MAMRREPERDEAYAIRIPKTAEIVADHIRRRIILGELAEGDSLPPENQLMEKFSVSRPTLREAFRILESEQLISVMRGSRTGARIHQPRVESVSRYAGFVLQSVGATLADIYEARLAIEPYCVRQLAEKRSPRALKRLTEELERLVELNNEAGRYVDLMIRVVEFHRVLVEVAGNKTLHILIRLLQDVLEQHQARSAASNAVSPDEQHRRGDIGIRSFRKLIDLIAAGQADEAEAHWRLHLINANKAWASEAERKKSLNIYG